MDAKKAKLKNVLTSLVNGQTEDLLFEVVQAWVQASVEERRTREMDDAMGQFTGKLSMLKTRQVETAMEVRERMNIQGEMTLLCKYWGHWRLSTKAERLDSYFKRKLESKRKQVAGVQTLFQTFATQIEANLDVDADDDDLGGHESRRRKRHSGSRSQGSLPRGTSVPLDPHRPDILNYRDHSLRFLEMDGQAFQSSQTAPRGPFFSPGKKRSPSHSKPQGQLSPAKCR